MHKVFLIVSDAIFLTLIYSFIVLSPFISEKVNRDGHEDAAVKIRKS